MLSKVFLNWSRRTVFSYFKAGVRSNLRSRRKIYPVPIHGLGCGFDKSRFHVILYNTRMHIYISDARKTLGRSVCHHRSLQGLTQVELAQRLGTSHSNIAAIENGKRAVGNQVAERLAAAVNLDAKTKPLFMLQAAATRIKDRLLEFAVRAQPALIHYAVDHLLARNLGPDAIKHAEVIRKVEAGEGGCVWENPRIKEQLHESLDGYFMAICGFTKSPFPFLKLTLKDGTKAYCGLVVAKA